MIIFETLILTIINRPEEAAFVEYQRKMENNKIGKTRIKALHTVSKLNFEPLKDRKFDAEMISEQARLLQLQGMFKKNQNMNVFILRIFFNLI